MKIFLTGAFLVLHGLVHLLYLGQSRRFFELRPDMVWPDGAWAFSRLLGDDRTRLLASISCVLAAIGFIAGATGLLTGQGWWRPVVVGAAIFSAALFILLWNGGMQNLADQGAIAILINVTILLALLVGRWPG